MVSTIVSPGKSPERVAAVLRHASEPSSPRTTLSWHGSQMMSCGPTGVQQCSHVKLA